MEMLLEDKNAVVYGAGGSIGGAVARAFAREGANVFLAGRTLSRVDEVAEEISASGGVAETAQVDALDEVAVGKHIGKVAQTKGRIDILLTRGCSPCKRSRFGSSESSPVTYQTGS
jgi:3-oxoacyl-[acyl-carrier protein] reductase